MNKFYKWIFLMVFTSLIGNVHSQIILNCDFEEAIDYSEWVPFEVNDINQWVIGSATATTPEGKSLYISNDNGDSFAYSSGVDNIGDNTNQSFAAISHSFTVHQAGYYVFEYDWKCVGEKHLDFMRVAIVMDNFNIYNFPPFDEYLHSSHTAMIVVIICLDKRIGPPIEPKCISN